MTFQRQIVLACLCKSTSEPFQLYIYLIAWYSPLLEEAALTTATTDLPPLLRSLIGFNTASSHNIISPRHPTSTTSQFITKLLPSTSSSSTALCQVHTTLHHHTQLALLHNTTPQPLRNIYVHMDERHNSPMMPNAPEGKEPLNLLTCPS